MTTVARQRWLVGALFTTLFLVFGAGFNTAGVFFTPLLDHFGWTRAELSLLQTAVALAAGLATPLVGFLLDRVEARAVIAAGAAMTGLGFLLASHAAGFTGLLAAYAVVGAGLSASTLLPCSLVIANWFGARRGLALGLAMAGTSAGGMAMTLVASRAIALGGWRAGYVTLALPMIVVVVPLVLTTVTTRPPGTTAASTAAAADALPGLEVAEALWTRSFWLLGALQFLYAFASTGANVHGIPHLIGLGYPTARAAEMLSAVLGLAAAGKLLMGWIGDRVGARRALVGSFLAMGAGLLGLISADRPGPAAAYVIVYGLAVGAPLALVPMLMADALGLRRFGSIAGLTGLLNVAGAACGPVVAGYLFDTSGRYAGAFQLFTLALVLAAVATLGCVPFAARTSAPRLTAATSRPRAS